MNASPPPARLYLVGFMAAGKSTIGRELARLTERRFVDLDEEIVLKEGRSINELFGTHGEPYFRKVETALLRTWMVEPGLVMAVGGGAFCSRTNRELLLNSGLVIWLDVPFPVLSGRLQQFQDRPLNSSREQIEQLYQTRLDDYRQAHIQIRLGEVTAEQAARQVLKATHGYAPPIPR